MSQACKSGDDARTTGAASFLALMVFVAGLCLQPVAESDVFFRVKVGQEILARHALMGRNLFSFTAPDHPDLDLSWGFEVGAALLYRLGGFPAIVVGKTAIVLVAFALAYLLCRRAGAGAAATAATLAGAAFVMRERFVERPHVVSFAGEVVVLLALAAVGPRWSLRRTLAFAAAMVAWANAHAGIFTGVLMALAAAAATLLCAAKADPSTSSNRRVELARARAFGLLAAGIAIFASATPVGWGIVRYLALHVSLPRLHTIDEFRSATWRSDAAFFGWLALVAAVTVVANSRRASGMSLADTLAALAPRWAPAVLMAALGLWSVRFSADAALVAAPLLATGLTSLFARAPVSRAARAAVVGTALLAAALAPRLADARAGRPFLSLDLEPELVPREAIQFVTTRGLRERMYNDFETGSYLAFEGYPRYRVFVDPRLPAYPPELHRLLGNFDLDRATWDAAMQRYGVTSALLAYAGVNRRVAWWDPERWALVYRAHDARVFVRRLPDWRALIAAYEIPATFSFTVEEGAATLPLTERPAASPVAACEWQRRLGDLLLELDGGRPARALPAYQRALEPPGCLAPHDEATLAGWLGATALQAKDFALCVALTGRALALQPADAATRSNRAVAYEALGRLSAAAEDWTQVARDSSDPALVRAATIRAQRLLSRSP